MGHKMLHLDKTEEYLNIIWSIEFPMNKKLYAKCISRKYTFAWKKWYITVPKDLAFILSNDKNRSLL